MSTPSIRKIYCSLYTFSLIATFILTLPSYAYYSTMDTGDLLRQGNHKVSAETQFITDKGSGANFVGRFDSGLTFDSNIRGMIGFGTTDFHIGGFYKWVPIPDIDNQPAIGLLAGVLYARDDGLNELSVRLHPLISKMFPLDFGDLTPYASLPIGLRSQDKKADRSSKVDVPVQIAAGAQLKTLHFERLLFNLELGFDINKAYTYISLGVSLLFDDEEGLIIR